MTNGLKPYSAVKDSGFEWLGAVPEHWEIRRLKQICQLAYGDALAAEVRKDGVIPVWGSNGPVGLHNSANTKAPCIVIGRKGSFGKVNYSDDPVFAIDTTFFVDDRFSSAHIRWLFFFLGWLRLDEVTRDSTVPGLDREDTYQKSVVVPPPPEQAAIARYLDHADRRIRRYIRAKQKLITLLEEQKQAIIHQAVAGQIDVRTGLPYPAYKPSGVEWLGDVPEHWELRRVKQSAQVLRGKFTHRPRNDPSLYDGPYPFIQTGEVARAERAITNYRQTLNERGLAVSRMFPAGTLVMTIAANIGDVAILDFEACFPDSVVGFVPRNGLERDFLYYVFRAMKPELLREAPVNTQGNLNMDRIGSRGIAIAPALEQRLIVRQIEASMARLKTVTDQARREISLLREYRTRLIADVVTGKVDVRETAAGLPEVDPLAGEFDALTTQAAETGMMELGEATETPEELAMENEVTI